MTKTRTSRPRALTPATPITEPSLYKAPMHLERQKFIQPRAISQLYFKEVGQEPDPVTVKTFGLDLDVGQARALAAVQILLHDTGFRGHESTEAEYRPTYKTKHSLPILRVTPSEFYEAYGLGKVSTGDTKTEYPGRMRQEALDDLLSLNKPRRIIYEKKRREGQRELSDIVITPESKLVDVHLVYEGLDQAEAEAVKAGAPTTSRLSGIVITCGIPLIDQADRYYVLKQRDLFKQIALFYPGTRQPRGASLLVEYLWTLDKSPFEIGKETLARTIGLGPRIDRRHRREALTDLETYLDHAKALGFLLDYSQNSFGNYVLELNPETCFRVKAKQKRKAINNK